MSEALFDIRSLKKYFPIKRGLFQKQAGSVLAVDDVSLVVKRGMVLGVVGESGCGKSTLARVMLDLIPATSGQIFFDGEDVLNANKRDKRKFRSRVNMVFQDPFSSLDPRMTVAKIVTEPMKAHKTLKGKEQLYRAVDLIEQCGLFADQIYRYPHQFSGGQRQRICIARALAAEPDFIVCDEAVSSLDVSIQAQVINLLLDLKDTHDLTYMFITHDLNVVRFISDEIVVMYLGQVVEKAPKEQLFENPLHPYTVALLNSVPEFDVDARKERIVLEGDVPSPSDPPPGCRFHTRCPSAQETCAGLAPELEAIGDGHYVRCHLTRPAGRMESEVRSQGSEYGG